MGVDGALTHGRRLRSGSSVGVEHGRRRSSRCGAAFSLFGGGSPRTRGVGPRVCRFDLHCSRHPPKNKRQSRTRKTGFTTSPCMRPWIPLGSILYGDRTVTRHLSSPYFAALLLGDRQRLDSAQAQQGPRVHGRYRSSVGKVDVFPKDHGFRV